MGVEEILLAVFFHPFRHNGAPAGDDARESLGGERQVFEQQSGVDGEIVHTLLALFYKGVAVHLPSKLLGFAVDFLKCLIDRHCAHRHRTVADNPLACLVDVGTRGEVHQGVAAPA